MESPPKEAPKILVGQEGTKLGKPQAGLGISVGCFAGAGYGLSVGIGALRPIGKKAAIVIPGFSQVPFAHDGALGGAFCGLFAGAGFASSIAMHIGYHWDIFPPKVNPAHAMPIASTSWDPPSWNPPPWITQFNQPTPPPIVPRIQGWLQSFAARLPNPIKVQTSSSAQAPVLTNRE